jgi:hypothetical protein
MLIRAAGSALPLVRSAAESELALVSEFREESGSPLESE